MFICNVNVYLHIILLDIADIFVKKALVSLDFSCVNIRDWLKGPEQDDTNKTRFVV